MGKLGDNLQGDDELRILKLLTSSQDTIPEPMDEDKVEEKAVDNYSKIESLKPISPYVKAPTTRALRETPSRIQNVVNFEDKKLELKLSALKGKNTELAKDVNSQVNAVEIKSSSKEIEDSTIAPVSKTRKLMSKIKTISEEKNCDASQVESKSSLKENESKISTVKDDFKSKSTSVHPKVNAPLKSGPIIALSGFRSPLKAELDKGILLIFNTQYLDISKLGGELLVNDDAFVANCDYLIVSEPIRSEKMFLAIITRKPYFCVFLILLFRILQKEYIQACKSSKQFIDFSPYLYSNMQSSNYEIIDAINFWTLNSSCELPKELNCKQTHEPSKYCNMFNGINSFFILLKSRLKCIMLLRRFKTANFLPNLEINWCHISR